MTTLARSAPGLAPTLLLTALAAVALPAAARAQAIGAEVAVPRHLADGDEFRISLPALVAHGNLLFAANWTVQEGAGRPQTKGTGKPLSDPTSPLVFPRNMNRVSAPDANSCAGCHNAPFGVAGGGGDFVTSVFVLAQRFDFATLDHNDPIVTRGAVEETGNFCTLDNVANQRATLGMFGAGYIEMLARQITAELQAIRDAIPPGGSAQLAAKRISFGILSRDASGAWDTSLVEGLAAPSLATTGPTVPPSLVIMPFHQAGAVISLRQFSNNAFNHHHGIQPTERFGAGVDPDADGFVDEMTVADVTAVSVQQATLAVPGRVIPRDPAIEAAVHLGESRFVSVGCATCHIPVLPLDNQGWVYTEPNAYNPTGNLQPSSAYVQTHGTFRVDLSDPRLPTPRLRPQGGMVLVRAFTDFKLHDITSGPNDPGREPLDMHQAPGSPGFTAGNSRFLTRKLWGVANEPPYFHHGKFTTMREAVEAHAGEASAVMAAYSALPAAEQDAIIEFLKTLQILPPGTHATVVDENYQPRTWLSDL